MFPLTCVQTSKALSLFFLVVFFWPSLLIFFSESEYYSGLAESVSSARLHHQVVPPLNEVFFWNQIWFLKYWISFLKPYQTPFLKNWTSFSKTLSEFILEISNKFFLKPCQNSFSKYSTPISSWVRCELNMSPAFQQRWDGFITTVANAVQCHSLNVMSSMSWFESLKIKLSLRILGLMLNDGLWVKAICWDCTSVYTYQHSVV